MAMMVSMANRVLMATTAIMANLAIEAVTAEMVAMAPSKALTDKMVRMVNQGGTVAMANQGKTALMADTQPAEPTPATVETAASFE